MGFYFAGTPNIQASQQRPIRQNQRIPSDWPTMPPTGYAPQGISGGQSGGPLDTNPNSGVIPPDTTQGGVAPVGDPFDPSKVPSGVPMDWAKDFIARNPGDYDRLASAYGSGGSSQGSGGPNYQTPSQAWNSQLGTQSDEFYKLLMDRANKSLNIDRMDPSIRNQVDPFIAQSERASRNFLNDLAEKAGPIANMRGEMRLAAEKQGQAAGQLEAATIGHERDAIRNEIAQALGLYSSQLAGDKSNELSRYLGVLGNDTARRGQDLGFDQFLRQLALNQWIAQDNSSYQWGSLGG